MEGIGVMALEKEMRERLAKTFKVPEDRCEDYFRVYNETLLPLIEEKYLAHLISVAEDLIFIKIKAVDPKAPRFKITLWKNSRANIYAPVRISQLPLILPGASPPCRPHTQDRRGSVFRHRKRGRFFHRGRAGTCSASRQGKDRKARQRGKRDQNV
jgi:hypothetical protein